METYNPYMNETTPLYLVDKLLPACEIYIVCNEAEVLMFKRAPDSKNFPNFLIGPGGHIDQDEDAMQAVIREAQEETSVLLLPGQVKLKVLSFHHHLDRKEVWIEYLFRADITTKPELKNDIEGSPLWMSIPDLLQEEKVFPPSKHYLEHILKRGTGVKYSSSIWNNLQLVKETSCHFETEF